MKMRNKGKVHPFTTSTPSPNTDSQSVLKLVPSAILTLVSLLSLEDREVLAYMITRSLKSTNPSFFPANEDKKKSSTSKKQCGGAHNSPALFHCDCFHCYTSFWFRWDSSPNRELINQAIEAFDDHLNSGHHFKNQKTKRRDRRKTDKLVADASAAAFDSPPAPENQEPAEKSEVDEGETDEAAGDDSVAAPVAVVQTTHKGLARKVLPDFVGLFHSRYWSLWSPNV